MSPLRCKSHRGLHACKKPADIMGNIATAEHASCQMLLGPAAWRHQDALEVNVSKTRVAVSDRH